MKILKHITLVLILLGLVGGWWLLKTWPTTTITRIIFCDVGQGDAILVVSGSTQLLVDGGEGRAVLDCIRDHVPFWDRTLEVVVATHPDADHIGGLNHVFDEYQALTILTLPDTHDTQTFDRFREKVSLQKDRGAIVISPYLGQTISLSKTVFFEVLSPQEKEGVILADFLTPPETVLWDKTTSFWQPPPAGNSRNDRSIVVLLHIGQVSLLLTGDVEEPSELAMVRANLINEVDILKVAHHGSKTSTSQAFLDRARPEIAVISSGENNSYGHPSPEVLERLTESGALVLRTDQRGTIAIVSDGQRFWLE